MAYVGFFTSDRAQKYGWGLPRLFVLTILSFELAPRLSSVVAAETASNATNEAGGIVAAGSAAALGLKSYFASGRWLGHFYVGSIGAVVNVEVLPLFFNLALLGGAAAFLIYDVVIFDYAALVYLAKTFSGDFLAGKLDTTEWRLVLAFSIAIWAVCWAMANGSSTDAITDGSSSSSDSGVGSSSSSDSARAILWDPYSRILPVLFLIQLVCEIGDAYFENLLFFRHRYSFESFTAMVLFCLPKLTPAELRVVQLDLVTCLGYRASNFTVILYRSHFFTAKNLEITLRKIIFRLFGWLRGTPLVNVSDTEVALAVLRASSNKGAALERYVATPAWQPILSLESVDGALWKGMLADFHKVLAVLPPPARLQQLAEKHVDLLLQRTSSSSNVIDAEAIAKWSIAVFAEFVWGPEVGGKWCQELDTIALASWEWRKEIAVRGKANRQVKANAVSACVALTRKCPQLWALLGDDKWTKPRGYSLLLQPFFLSPAINAGDIAVALQTFPRLNVEEAIRQMHPFPILERFVEKDILSKDGATVLVKGGTQVIMFTSDFVPQLAEADKKKNDDDDDKDGSDNSSSSSSGSSPVPPAAPSSFTSSPPPSASSALKKTSSSERLSSLGLPAYGAGPRQCAGAHLARPLLKVLETKLRSSPKFMPEIGHKYSGRNNDGNVSMGEMWYFARTVLPVLFTFRQSRRTSNKDDDDDGSDSAAVEAAANAWTA